MARQTLFVDANLFLHYRFFEEVDWRECVSGDEVVLALCPAMTAELDKKKFAADTPKIRDRAKRVIPAVDRTGPAAASPGSRGLLGMVHVPQPRNRLQREESVARIPDHVISR